LTYFKFQGYNWKGAIQLNSPFKGYYGYYTESFSILTAEEYVSPKITGTTNLRVRVGSMYEYVTSFWTDDIVSDDVLDFEKQNLYTLTVRVSDDAALIQEAQIRIRRKANGHAQMLNPWHIAKSYLDQYWKAMRYISLTLMDHIM
jgi:hypothetical protein